VRGLKKILLVLIVILILVSHAFCSTGTSTISTGVGVTKEEAIQDALRKAVESVTGVFVYSTSEVKDFTLVRDEIVTASKGYVKEFKIISDSKVESSYFVTLNVYVDTAGIQSTISRNIKTSTYEDVIRDYAATTSVIEKNIKLLEVLKSISSRPLEELYPVQYSGYEIVDAGTKSVDVVLKFV